MRLTLLSRRRLGILTIFTFIALMLVNFTLTDAPLYDALHSGGSSNVDDTYTMYERCHMTWDPQHPNRDAIMTNHYTHRPDC